MNQEKQQKFLYFILSFCLSHFSYFVYGFDICIPPPPKTLFIHILFNYFVIYSSFNGSGGGGIPAPPPLSGLSLPIYVCLQAVLKRCGCPTQGSRISSVTPTPGTVPWSSPGRTASPPAPTTKTVHMLTSARRGFSMDLVRKLLSKNMFYLFIYRTGIFS